MVDHVASQPASKLQAALTFVFLLTATAFAVSRLTPPEVVPASGSAREFSAERARVHLKVIAREPHPDGSVPDARVRDYLVEQLKLQGLEPQVQRTGIASLADTFPGPYGAGTVENVFARLKGTNSTGVLLLTAHYDSVSTAPGATDDGSGVVTLLETLRALRNGATLKNDVIFLFTEGEELGMVGAQGFVDEHPWAKEVTVVWSVDSGGSCGPANLYFPNGWMVQEFARSVPHPIAGSIGDELAKLGPAGGDDAMAFDPNRVAISGASYSGCRYRYHTAMDTVENTSLRSIQHLGIYTLAVARDLGNVDLAHPPAKDESVYFVLLGKIANYPVAWTRPLALLAGLLFAATLWLGRRRKQLTLRATGVGALLWLVSGLLVLALTEGLWWGLESLHLVNHSYASAYNAETYALAFVALAIATTAALYSLVRKKIDANSLAMGALLLCLLLAIATAWSAPGASYLFLWPLVFGLLPLGLFFWMATSTFGMGTLWLVCAVPTIFLFAPLILFMIITVTEPMPTLAVAGALTVIVLSLLVPQIETVISAINWHLPTAFGVLAVGLVGWGAIHSGFDRTHPRPDTIAYWLDADSGKASWVSLDQQPDSWTSQFLTGQVERGKLNLFVAPGGEAVLKTAAPPLQLSAPEITKLADSIQGNEHLLRFRIVSLRQASTLWVAVQNATIVRATIDGKKVPSKMVDPQNKLWGFYYAAPSPDGIELAIVTQATDAPRITVTDQTNGLPDIPGFHATPRTADLMPLNYFPAFDCTILVSHTYGAHQSKEH
jgi:hypothetical protein